MLFIGIILCIIAIILEAYVSERINILENININYNEKYVKKDYLLTQTELKFYKSLKQITDELNLVICPQVTLYQIVNNKNYKDFNKIKSKSIDFVIAEPNLKIKLCIELDDYTHKQSKRIKRDDFINNLFNDLGIKLIRIPVQNYYDLEDLRNKIKESLCEVNPQ